MKRCWWPGEDELYVRYHDQEWGRPVVDDQRLFEKACLEGFQSGLSWITILRKRGWTFVGPTTCYAFMQAMGLVNDHVDDCDVRPEIERARAKFIRPATRR